MTEALGLDSRRADSASALGPPAAVVTAISTTAVKGLQIGSRAEVVLTPTGAADDRRFYLVDDDARMVNGKGIGALCAVRAVYDAETRHLTLLFPDGVEVGGSVLPGAELQTRFFSRTPTARLVGGPFSQALSDHAGVRLRLVEADVAEGAVDRGPAGAVSLVSEASLARLSAEAGGRPVDARRFRMLFDVAGVEAHAEDEWVGRSLRIGGARVAVRGHVGRCLVTSRSPETGVVDLPTLELLGYRRDLPTSERLAFGVFGEVLEPGVVRLGDEVTLD